MTYLNSTLLKALVISGCLIIVQQVVRSQDVDTGIESNIGLIERVSQLEADVQALKRLITSNSLVLGETTVIALEDGQAVWKGSPTNLIGPKGEKGDVGSAGQTGPQGKPGPSAGTYKIVSTQHPIVTFALSRTSSGIGMSPAMGEMNRAICEWKLVRVGE